MSGDIVSLVCACSNSDLAQFIFKLVIDFISFASSKDIASRASSIAAWVGFRR